MKVDPAGLTVRERLVFMADCVDNLGREQRCGESSPLQSF
jgi:hypothetical protein